ncbi:3-oxoacyl-ACP reductase FabG [Fictibacillus fluitans]|uniref:3-oxoacyl-ACP reductase FabG n=1 Tax=Fictibacillus fluitans TaxID=3058422 RepID=A0ABT8HQF3_9BACL|nr:3-oxoacyl-ACP reductase FabG [Fictibacillus sp. NE201]MDN4522994.1 3-oxoacyl-ACP reductase FabG [Fictibacillus sp. NE201]
MKRLNGRSAFITGGSRGIGKAIAKAFASEGAKVCVADLQQQALLELEQEFTQEGWDLFTFQMDVTDKHQVEQGFYKAVEEMGSLDILVNNAGITRDNLLFKMEDDDWDKVMDVHLKGTFYCSRAAQAYMVKQRFGRIINISSVSALGNRGQANYSTAKAGLQGLTKTLAIELGPYGITVNAIGPGFIETAMTQATADRLGMSFEELIAYKTKEIPVGRTGKPEDIAQAALFFADNASSFVNGQVLYVTGGPAV